MLIDFCDYAVNSQLSADKVSIDGYEVFNLKSGDFQRKARGFMSEHFIKPPVNITVQFPCNVSIYRIVIDPVIGQQQSCDIKLFSASQPLVDANLNKSGCETDKSMSTKGVIFNYIGSVYQDNPCVVCFQNNHFRERGIWTKDNMKDIADYPSRGDLRSSRDGNLKHASHLSITVTRTKGSRSVAIKRLEIWGMPAFKVHRDVQLALFKKFTRNATNIEADSINISSESTKEKSSVLQTVTGNETCEFFQDGVAIPEDFVDQITFEIMAVPMMLPCGKNIDQSTLERFVNIEASWGRQPSDPFTGVVFTPAQKAVTNTSLKARIDQFVLKNSHILNVARTLGHKSLHGTTRKSLQSSRLLTDIETVSNSSKPCNSVDITKVYQTAIDTPNINSQSSSSRKRKFNKTLDPSDTVTQKVTRSSVQTTSSKKHSYYDVHVSKLVCLDKEDRCGSSLNTDCYGLQSKTKSDSNFIDLTSIPLSRPTVQPAKIHQKSTVKSVLRMGNNCVVTSSSSTNHSENLSSSLDTALFSTLNNLPSFNHAKSVQAPKGEQSDNLMQCSMCNTNLKGNNSVIKYKLPCQHFICRSCAQNSQKDTKCAICLHVYDSSMVVRVFD